MVSVSAQFRGQASLILNLEFRILKIRLACAFGNEVALTDDFVIVWATRTSASPHSKQINFGLLWGEHTPQSFGQLPYLRGAVVSD